MTTFLSFQILFTLFCLFVVRTIIRRFVLYFLPTNPQFSKQNGGITSVDWAELPQDIIESISKRLTIYSDYLRFRCVCRTWNSYAPKTPLHLPPQLPWLMLSHKSFFDPYTNKIHHLNLPISSSINTPVCGSSFGWLVILHQTSEVLLLNPITQVTLSLPTLYTLPEFVRKPLDYNNNLFLDRIVLSSSPSLSNDFAAVAILNLSLDFSQLAFCKKGYGSWVLFNVNENYKWINVLSKSDLFYAVSSEGMIAVCDVEGPRVSFIETTNSLNIMKGIRYFMFSGEDMLLISRYLLKEDEPKTERFRILKMNWNMLHWDEIHTLGKKVLYVGHGSCVSFSDADFVGCPPNRIYFANSFFRKGDFGIFSLSDESVELLAGYPQISDRPFGCPIWVTPNPR